MREIFFSKSKAVTIISIFLAAFLLITLASCNFHIIRPIEKIRDMMGTYVSITLSSNEYTGNKAINTAFDRMKEIEDIATIYNENSEASFLNINGYLDNPSPEFLNLINASLYYYDISSGCFDITVKPLSDLWWKGLWQESEEVQTQKVEEMLNVTGSDKLKVTAKRIEFMVNGMGITLGAIAKGYAVDEAVKVLKEFGIEQALVNAGGDLYAMGVKPDGESWTISILEPPVDYGNNDSRIEPLPVFIVVDKAVATSGNYYRYYDPEKEVGGHIINPKTGYISNRCISVTIIADTCMEADALATSVFVMEPDEGMKLVESLDNVEALIIDYTGKVYKSSGLSEYIK